MQFRIFLQKLNRTISIFILSIINAVLIVVSKIFSFAVDAIVVILGLVFILSSVSANPATIFTQWLYYLSDPLILPFKGIFQPVTVGGWFILDFGVLFALVIYALVGFGIKRVFFSLNKSVSESLTAVKLHVF
ncbi:MAG: hypothetical protein WCW87_03660 [Candidatus Paceibacterota bacterium]